MELQTAVVSPIPLDPYDSSASSVESTNSSVFGRPRQESPICEKGEKSQFSFDKSNSNAEESINLINRKESSYDDSGISPGVFENQDSERRMLIGSGRSVTFKDV